MGPLWDFDISLGNTMHNYNHQPENFWIKEFHWTARLFEDPLFVSQVKDRWNEKKQNIEKLLFFIDERAMFLDEAQERNFQKWEIWDVQIGAHPVIPGGYQGEIDFLKYFLSKRIKWLDTAIKKLE